MYYSMPYRSTAADRLSPRARAKKEKRLVRIDNAPRVLIIFFRPLGSIFVQYLSIIRGGYANKGKKSSVDLPRPVRTSDATLLNILGGDDALSCLAHPFARAASISLQ
jgi:hypothetical protein